MRNIYLLIITIFLHATANAESGKCIALGRMANEDKICAQYNNTNENKCTEADGHAWCSWEPTKTNPSTINHRRNNPEAPLKIECTKENGNIETVRVMRILFDTKNSTATGFDFGPDRGDEGYYDLKGLCQVTTDVRN